jgi:hypothetical protein
MSSGRTIDEVIDLLSAPPGTPKGTSEACGEIEAWAKAGRTSDLTQLLHALESKCPEALRAQFEIAADHVEDQLALATSPGALEALLELSLTARTRSVVVPRDRALRVRSFASRLGFGQPKTAFLGALARAGAGSEHRELLACWMHEIVLRGTSLEAEPAAQRFRESLAAANHPLAGLPLALRTVEREAPSYMPLYGDKGLGRAIERLTSGAMSVRTVPPPADGASVRATRQEDPDTTKRLLAAVEPWSKHEAKVFALSPPVEGGAVGSWLLRALPLDSTTATARIDCSRTGAEGVFGPLFSASSNGGAFSAGSGGAYGRRAAWTSLGALVGVPASAGIDEIERAAGECTFLSFRAPGPWFYDIAWDIGALVLRPDGRSVAVLAATDTDGPEVSP